MTSFAPPVEIAAWLACASFLVFLFNQASRAAFTLRGKPSPIEQAKATNDISERVGKIEQCIGSCKREQDRRLDALESSQAEMRELISVEIDKVFRRVNNVADASATMTGELGIIKTQLNLLIERKGK